MSIQIDREQQNQLFDHAEKIYPEECCGIILGNITDEKKVILKIIPTHNVWDEELAKTLTKIVDLSAFSFSDRNDGEGGNEKRRNFFIAPEEILKAQKEARKHNAIVLGFYHSHPDAAAIPSEFDRAIAWSGYSYLIISLTRGKVKALRSWQLDKSQKFQPEDIEITDLQESFGN